MLALLLRSLVAPVLLTLSVVLSYLAALGLSSLAFRWILGFAGIDSSVALLAFVSLGRSGLTTRSSWRRGSARRLPQTLRVGSGWGGAGGHRRCDHVCGAPTFTVLGVLPLVALMELGFLVAVEVLLDTFIVRSLVVPAVALLLGERLWWPWRPHQSRPQGSRGGIGRGGEVSDRRMMTAWIPSVRRWLGFSWRHRRATS